VKELSVALAAAREGAAVILKYYGKTFKIKHKGEINLVTEVDEKAQAAIVAVIRRHFPKDAVLAEELDLSKTARAARRWIVDPIDGTTNFAHGYPRFCVSIGFEESGVLKAGIILDPVMKETFSAVKGKGAFLNGKKIRVSKISKLKQALLVTGFPYDLYAAKTNNIPYFLHLMFKAQAIRRDGSAALNMAYIACGRFDGFWELGLSAWDVSAGILIIREAGGKVLTLKGKLAKVTDPAIIAGNPKLCRILIKECAKIKSQSPRLPKS